MLSKDHQNAPTTTVVRDLKKLEDKTGNIYESIAIVSKRANQIAANMKEELHNKLQEFANDAVYVLGEVCNNENVPHPTIVTESGRVIAAYHSV
ncbi:MAG: DNA-directed RNA polymerase subunit omega, partial [Bacteroidota bacterium]